MTVNVTSLATQHIYVFLHFFSFFVKCCRHFKIKYYIFELISYSIIFNCYKQFYSRKHFVNAVLIADSLDPTSFVCHCYISQYFLVQTESNAMTKNRYGNFIMLFL